jgi:hypothetical protein
MVMNDLQLPRVFEAARLVNDDLRVPYAFEKRVMAKLRSRKSLDIWGLWARTLWRAAMGCVALSLVTGGILGFNSEAKPSDLLASDLEQTMLAPIRIDEAW